MLTIIENRKKRPKRDILFVHGAWSSGASFTYIREALKNHPNLGRMHTPRYDIQFQPLPRIIELWKSMMDVSVASPCIVVGHSLGGIISLHLHDSVYCDSIITIASPLNGMHVGLAARGLLYWRSPFLMDAFEGSLLVKEMHDKTYTKPIDQICAVDGFSPFMTERNDGVLTVSSQTKWKPTSATQHMVHLNHTEVLMNEYVVQCIKRHLEMPQ